MMELEEQALTNITDPHDTDVLSGRGGAVNRHPGNKIYLDLVNRNKVLYTTRPAVEKHIISLSIVVAIREIRGRFLEKNVIDGTWSDIGNKKATLKTKQALREPQSEQNTPDALKLSHFVLGSDFSFMSGISMVAFLHGIVFLSKRAIRSLTSGGINKKATGKTSHALPERQSEHNTSSSLRDSLFSVGADISANDHGLPLDPRVLHQQSNNPSETETETEATSGSDYSFISMNMGAFVDGTLDHSKRNVSNLSDGMNPNSIRSPSIGEPHGPNGPVSEMTMDGALDVNPDESTLDLDECTLSLRSEISKMSIE
jgi:hypothetical protein